MRCNDPISLEMLVAYWLGEVGEVGEEQEALLETHFFGCAYCTKRLEELAALASGVRAAVTQGKVSLAVSGSFVEALRRTGLRLREYRVQPGGSVNCTISADDDAVVSRLQAPLAGVTRVDLVRMRGSGAPEVRVADVPFDAEGGEVLVIPSAKWLKTMPAFTMQMRLIAVGAAQEETAIGDYTFNHAPS